MKNRHRDFAALFKWMWFADFPVDSRWAYTRRASTWTIHVGTVVQKCAGLMGLYARNEERGRSDAALYGQKKQLVALVEWEWEWRQRKWMEEVQKLCKGASDHEKRPEFCFLLFYPPEKTVASDIKALASAWTANSPLLAAAVTHDGKGKRSFDELVLYEVQAEKAPKRLHSLPASPWLVEETRWFEDDE